MYNIWAFLYSLNTVISVNLDVSGVGDTLFNEAITYEVLTQHFAPVWVFVSVLELLDCFVSILWGDEL